VRNRLLPALAGALLCGAPACAQEAGPITDPGVLFSTACANGQARLPRNQFDDVAYAAMPVAARGAFATALGKGQAATPLADREVPNRILTTLPGRDVYLLLPAEGLPGATAGVCSVVWKGAMYDGAIHVLESVSGTTAPTPPSPAAPGSGTRYHQVVSGDHAIAATERDGWTALVIQPVAPTQATKPR
jgi:hypothetical protein